MIRPLLFALTAVAIAAPLSAKDKEVPPATPTGPAVDCVNLSQVRETHVRSDKVIDFELNSRKMLRNTLPASCPGLGFEERFAYSVTGNQLCSVDTITVLQSGGVGPGPRCGLGKFQPVTITK